MRVQVSLGVLIGVAVTATLFLVRPDWFSGGLLGFLLGLCALLTGLFIVSLGLTAAAEPSVPAERRGAQEWSWLHLILFTAGVATLFWLVVLTQPWILSLTLALSAILGGSLTFGIARWRHIRPRGSRLREERPFSAE